MKQYMANALAICHLLPHKTWHIAGQKRLFCVAAAALLVLQGKAQTYTKADSAVVERQRLLNDIRKAAWQNPALYGAAYRQSYSALTLTGDYSRANRAFVLQQGEGKTAARAQASSYLHLSKRATAWGKAAYSTGKNRQIKWNSTADYMLLAPYILADSVGGDTRTEQYSFSGGYAAKLNRWCIGGEIDFRAEQEYRNRDPRMRAVVSDLTFSVGTAYRLSAYEVGLAAKGNIYRQSNDVDIYNEAGGASQYMMTGLGTHYQRFSGSETDVYYEGHALSLLLNAAPAEGSGLYADAQFTTGRVKRNSDVYNSLPLSTLYSDAIGGNIGWLRKTDRADIALYGHYSFERKHGDEHIAGNASANAYPVIATLTMYHQYRSEAYLGATYSRHARLMWEASARLGYLSTRQSYAYVERKQAASHVFGRLEGQLFCPLSTRFMLSGKLGAAYFGKTRARITMPYADMEPAITRMVNYNHRQMTANHTALDAQLRGDYRLQGTRYALFAVLHAGFNANSQSTHNTALGLSLGFKF